MYGSSRTRRLFEYPLLANNQLPWLMGWMELADNLERPRSLGLELK